jgi:predicted TIM-barrel fold metal-dependent hydrolase
MQEYSHIYTDFSYSGVNLEYYRLLRDVIRQNVAIEERILFGSDFMINLLDIDSYHDYLHGFVKTHFLSDQQKDSFCSKNPERFLFNLP